MNPCIEYETLLDAFADGELTAEETASVQAHLDACRACRAYLDDLLAIRASFPAAEELPEGFAERVLSAVSNTPQSRPKRQPWKKMAIAAACLCCILLVQRQLSGRSLRMTADSTAPTAESAAEPREFSLEQNQGAQADMSLSMAPESEAHEEAPAAGAAAEKLWVEHDNVIFSRVAFLTVQQAGSALDGYEGRPYTDALRPEVRGTGYAMEQEDFLRLLDTLDAVAAATDNTDSTTTLCCIVVTE